jgi:hypothetical protein
VLLKEPLHLKSDVAAGAVRFRLGRELTCQNARPAVVVMEAMTMPSSPFDDVWNRFDEA